MVLYLEGTSSIVPGTHTTAGSAVHGLTISPNSDHCGRTHINNGNSSTDFKLFIVSFSTALVANMTVEVG
jgi:hypothetical protein